MKRILVIFIGLTISLFTFAQKHYATAESHSFLVWGSGGISTTADQLDWTTTKLGGGGMLGAGYQWQKRLFIINTGAELSFQHRTLSVSNTQIEQDMLDTEQMPFTYRGYIKDRTDNMNSLDINLPLMVGMKGEKAYFLAGLKFSINAYTWTDQHAMYSTDGLYDRFYDPLVNMPNHGFHDYEPASSKHSCWLGAELMGAVEAGIVIPTSNKNTKIRLGLFADYGIYQYNVRIINNQGPALQADWKQNLQLTLNHAYLSNEGIRAALHNVNAGIKLTIQWQYESGYPCLICRWNHSKFN